MEPGVVLIGGDFAENYHFVVQDAVQALHWSNDQVTLHPFKVYYRETPHSEVVGLSIVMISDELQHDTKAVYTFQCKLLDYYEFNFNHVEPYCSLFKKQLGKPDFSHR